MHSPVVKSIRNFSVIGTSFLKADSITRGRFAIAEQAKSIYEEVKQIGFSEFMLLSTCNRTEMYGCAGHSELRDFLCKRLSVSSDEFEQYFYSITGTDAVRHFFRVAAGLDSQIIGDYEIMGQVKAALDAARTHGLVGTVTDRISNFAFQASKRIKSQTTLSSGKYSVSFATAQLLLHEGKSHPFNHILVVGTGDFGSTVAKNLRSYFPGATILLTNRTLEKAEKVAEGIGANVLPFEDFRKHLGEFDVVITTTGAKGYLMRSEDIRPGKERLFLDLSVPQAIDPVIEKVDGVRLLSIDAISAFHNKLLLQRKNEIPHAERIVDHYIEQLMEWHHIHSHRHIILDYKRKFQNLACHYAASRVHSGRKPHRLVEVTFSNLIQQIKSKGYAGCALIEAMNALIPTE
ncbi:MAG: glutamyl-tRNA reductase [Cyclobacteriaceae bacterium]